MDNRKQLRHHGRVREHCPSECIPNIKMQLQPILGGYVAPIMCRMREGFQKLANFYSDGEEWIGTSIKSFHMIY